MTTRATKAERRKKHQAERAGRLQRLLGRAPRSRWHGETVCVHQLRVLVGTVESQNGSWMAYRFSATDYQFVADLPLCDDPRRCDVDHQQAARLMIRDAQRKLDAGRLGAGELWGQPDHFNVTIDPAKFRAGRFIPDDEGRNDDQGGDTP